VVLFVLLVDLVLLDSPLQHEHEGLGDADIAVLVDAVATAAVAVLALEARGPAAAMTRRVLHEGAGREDAAELVVDGREGDSDGGRHFLIFLSG
jgi:hypothetical protein